VNNDLNNSLYMPKRREPMATEKARVITADEKRELLALERSDIT